MGPADWINVGLNGAQIVWQVVQTVYLWIMMDNMLNGAWLLEQARKFGFEFDQILISFADKVYNLFCEIIGGTLLTPEVISGLMARLYLLVGLLIFFRIAITMIRYVVSPETFLDDKVGAGNLVKRIIMGCVLIVAIPLIFNTANKLQSAILNDKLIERIILPKYAYSELTGSNDTGKRLTMLTFQGFFGWNNSVPTTEDPSIYSAYSRVVLYEDVASFNTSYITAKASNGEYIIYYVPIISTLAVGYILYTLIKYTLEIALRSFKLAFLQIISPFVIVNYMLNPGHDEPMRKWTMTTVSTYILMFVRVITLWFMALMGYYLKYGIPDNEGGATSLINSTDPFVKAVIVIALFVFLKELPKLLSEMLGIDLQENETINGLMQQGVNAVKGFAMGKVGSSFAKKQLAMNAVGAGLGGASGAVGGYIKQQNEYKHKNNGQSMPRQQALGTGILSTTNSFGTAMGPMVGNVGSAVSSSFGSTIAGPIAHSAGLAQNHYQGYTDVTEKNNNNKDAKDKEKDKDKRRRDDEETETIMAPEDSNYNRNSSRYSQQNSNAAPNVQFSGTPTINVGAEVSENVLNNVNNSEYINADGTYNLSGSSNSVINEIRNEVNNKLVSNGSSGSITNENITQVIREQVSDPTHVSKEQITVIAQKAYDNASPVIVSNTSEPQVIETVPDVTESGGQMSYVPTTPPGDGLRSVSNPSSLNSSSFEQGYDPFPNLNNNNRGRIDEQD